jgi:hypothetical protein
VRGTTADAKGNVTLEHEAFPQEMLAIAQAARNSGGMVIAQVKRVSDAPLHPQRVRIPGFLVDHVVVCESPDQHWMSWGEAHNPAYVGEADALEPAAIVDSLDINRIIQRRALLELAKVPGAVVNVGIGIPAGLPALARAQGYDDFTLTIESGVVGGVAAEELSFGAASRPDAVIEQAAMFDFLFRRRPRSELPGDAAIRGQRRRQRGTPEGPDLRRRRLRRHRAECTCRMLSRQLHAGGLQIEAATGSCASCTKDARASCCRPWSRSRSTAGSAASAASACCTSPSAPCSSFRRTV